MDAPQVDDDDLRPRRGGQVGVGGALAMGGLLVLAAGNHPALVACVVAGTAAVATIAHRVGRAVGRPIARGSLGSARRWAGACCRALRAWSARRWARARGG